MRTACHSPPHPDHRILLQSTSHHLLSLFRQIPTHPNAKLSESGLQEFPASLRATHHSPLMILRLNQSSLLIFPCILFINCTPSCTVILSCSKVNPLLFKAILTPSIHSIWSSLALYPFHPRFKHFSPFFHHSFARHVQTTSRHISLLFLTNQNCTPTLLIS